MFRRDGFPGQRLRVLPQPLVDAASRRPVTDRMLVTDAGYFPHAAAHGRARLRGSAQAIVIACTGGAGVLELPGQKSFRVGAGAVAVIPSGTPHRYSADPHDPWSIWWLHVQGEDVAGLVSVIVGDGEPVLRPLDPTSITAPIEDAVAALERDDTESMLYLAAGAAWRVLSQLASDRLRGPAQTGDRIRAVQDHLRAHLAEPHTVPELAALASLSVSHFSSLFRATAGIGAVEYLKRLRSARARELLLTTDAPVSEIAGLVGYPDAFYFSRQFRALNGMSPSEFRLRGAGDGPGPWREPPAPVTPG